MIGMSHLGICVSNLDRSVRFYTEALGAVELGLVIMDEALPKNYRSLLETPKDTEGFSKFVGLDGLLIELLYYTRDGKPGGHTGPASRRPMNQLGYTHLGLRVPDPEVFKALPQKIRDFGGDVLDETLIDVGSFNGELLQSIFATDPDGTRIELMRLPDNFPIGGTVYRPRSLERA